MSSTVKTNLNGGFGWTRTLVGQEVLGSVALGIAAVVAHNTGFLAHEAVLMGAKIAAEARSVLQDLDEGEYVQKKAVSFFCQATASLATTGSLPDQATSWRSFVQARVGYDEDSTGYFEGKLAQLQTAVDLAQHNPKAAALYVDACKFT
jgi:hypothetical protein